MVSILAVSPFLEWLRLLKESMKNSIGPGGSVFRLSGIMRFDSPRVPSRNAHSAAQAIQGPTCPT